jgi:hypothetical protein
MKVAFFIQILAITIIGCSKSDDHQVKNFNRRVVSSQTDSAPSRIQGQITWQDSSYSKVSTVLLPDGDQFETLTENQTFLHGYTWKYGYSDPSAFVISQNIRWSIGPHEGNGPYLKAKCYFVQNDRSAVELWSMGLEADEGKLNEPFYQTIWYGCCGADNNNTLFNLVTGNKIMEYTENLLKVNIPNSGHPQLERYIGFKCNNTVPTEPYQEYKSDSLYAKIVLRGKPNFGHSFDMVIPKLTFSVQDSTDQIRGQDELELWSANSQNNIERFDHFGLRLTFYDLPDTVIIPISKDKIVLSNVEYPTLTIQVLK